MQIFSRLTAIILVAAVVIVPTVVRSRQHIDLREKTRLSIRLNWQSEAPPQRDHVVHDDGARHVVVSTALEQQSDAPRVRPVAHAFDEPVLQPPFDNAPDRFRGPPSLLS